MSQTPESTGGRSLVRALGVTYAFLVTLILLVGITGVAAHISSAAAGDRVFRSVQPAREANAAVLLSVGEVQNGVRRVALTGDPSFLDDARHGLAAYERSAGELRRLAAGAGVRDAVDEELAAADAWISRHADALGGGRQDSGLSARQLSVLRGSRDDPAAAAEIDVFRRLADEVDRRLAAEAARLRARATDARRSAVGVLVGVLALSVLLGGAAAARTSRRLVGPLTRLRREVEQLTGSTSDRRLDESSGPHEVRAVAAAVNAMAAEGHRLRALEQDQVRVRRLAHDVGLRIRESIDIEEVLHLAVEEIGSAFGADRVFVRCIGEQGLGEVVAEWNELDVEPLDPPALAALAATDSARHAQDLWADVSVDMWTMGRQSVPSGTPAPGALAVARVCGAMGVMVVAFGAGSQALGTVTLAQLRHPREWSEAEVAALQAVAADLGRAVRHASLYERERALVEQLRELDRTKTDFLSTVSHELRSPLTSITGYIELLRDESDSLRPSQSRMLDVIERNSYRLRSLIEDLLTLSRIESGAAETQRVPTDVSALVANAVSDVGPAAHSAGLDLRMVPGPPGARVLGDPGLLDRVLLNLLSNAVKFTPAGGQVRVSWEACGDEVRVVVADSGIGIPESEQPLLSTRFFRASNAMGAAIPGTGLGLSIVRGILDNHGGRLEVESSGQGTRVVVHLPRLAPAEIRGAGTTVAGARL